MTNVPQLPADRHEISREPAGAGRPGAALWLHLCAIAAAAALPLLPPASGPMLIVPIIPGAPGAVNLAVNHDARLLGLGPLPGSLVVDGSRRRLMTAALSSGFLLMAGTSPACSSPTTTDGPSS